MRILKLQKKKNQSKKNVGERRDEMEELDCKKRNRQTQQVFLKFF